MNYRYSILVAIITGLLITSVAVGQPTFNFVRSWDQHGLQDTYIAVAVNSNGSIFAAGFSRQTATTYECVMAKYYGSPSLHNNLVFNDHNYGTGTVNQAFGICVKGAYYYVTGRSRQSYYKIVTVREDTSGYGQTSVVFHNTSTSSDYGQFVFANNGSGDTIYVGGTTRVSSPTNNTNVILLKYASTGPGLTQVGSAVSFDGFTNLDDTLKAMTIDANNNVYIASKSYEGGIDGWDIYVAKYDRNLSLQWKSYYPSGANEEPWAIDVDANGYVYVTGTSGSNAVTAKWGPAGGSPQWAATYTNGFGYDVASHNNAVYMTGGTGSSALTVKYNASGTQQWADVVSSCTDCPPVKVGYKMKIDTTGNAIYVGGGVGDLLFIKYDSSGSRAWIYPYNGPSQRHDNLTDMAVDARGNIISAGMYQNSNQASPDDQDFQIASFYVGGGFASKAIWVNGVEAPMESRPSGYTLSQNYPNPFNPSTTIRYELPEDGQVIMKVYDMVGREVKTILDGQIVPKGIHEVTFDASSLASGAYFYRIMVGNGKFREIKRMMFLK